MENGDLKKYEAGKMKRLSKLLTASCFAVFLCASSALGCGTVKMYGALYFAAGNGDVACKLRALKGLMCVTPLPVRYYQTPGAQEILRLVLRDAMHEKTPIRRAAKEVYERYRPFDKYHYLRNIGSYEPDSDDAKLMKQLREDGVKLIERFCKSRNGK